MAGWKTCQSYNRVETGMGVDNIKQTQVSDNLQDKAYTLYAGEHVLLVAGGWQMPELNFLDSVELLTLGNSAWEFSTPLPRAMSNMGSVTLDNKVKFHIYILVSIYSPNFGLDFHSWRWK